jgi:hypothetical protein
MVTARSRHSLPKWVRASREQGPRVSDSVSGCARVARPRPTQSPGMPGAPPRTAVIARLRTEAPGTPARCPLVQLSS